MAGASTFSEQAALLRDVGFVDVQFNGQGWDLPANVIPDFKDATTAAAAGSSVQIAYTGGAVQEQPQQGASELIGIGVAIIILLIVAVVRHCGPRAEASCRRRRRCCLSLLPVAAGQ